MKLTKLDDRYEFIEEGNNNYTLNLGIIKQYEDTTTTYRIDEVDAENLYMKTTCGCTIVDKKVIDPLTAIIGVKYKECEASIMKVIEIREGATKTVTGLFKIKGQCHNNM